MKQFFWRAFLYFLVFFTFSDCQSQPGRKNITRIDRQPAVAGSFYPASREELISMLKGFFDQTQEMLKAQPLAIIVPHAGYIFSGEVASAAYRQIDRNKKFDHIFILGPSHTQYFKGASVYTAGNFLTPLGRVEIDSLGSWLVNHNKILNDDPRPHINEHCIEVQLPFLQYWMKQPFRIVPIVIGDESPETCYALARALEPFFNENNLFIISTDFSHYPDYDDAVKSDQMMSDAISTNSPDKFMNAKQKDESRGTPNLLTAMCGWTAALTLLDITERLNDISYRKLMYRNSGDSGYGDKNRVVGYNAFGIVRTSSRTETGFSLNREDKIELLKIARETLTDYLRQNQVTEINASKISSTLKIATGAFVTLTEKGQLRGCIGNMKSDQPLYKLVQEMVIASATKDYRFSPVKENELTDLQIEISVLTPMKKISSIDEIVLGRDGIYILKGGRSGTFLPQVAGETNWTLKEFLGHCAQDKAFIGWNGWKDAEIYTYRALVFSESEFSGDLK